MEKKSLLASEYSISQRSLLGHLSKGEEGCLLLSPHEVLAFFFFLLCLSIHLSIWTVWLSMSSSFSFFLYSFISSFILSFVSLSLSLSLSLSQFLSFPPIFTFQSNFFSVSFDLNVLAPFVITARVRVPSLQIAIVLKPFITKASPPHVRWGNLFSVCIFACITSLEIS